MRGAGLARRIRILNSETTQNSSLQRFHHLGLPVSNVIVTEKVEEPVNDEMGEVVVEGQVLLSGLSQDGFPGEHDIADEGTVDLAARRRAGKR
jgi:hypothetical protein